MTKGRSGDPIPHVLWAFIGREARRYHLDGIVDRITAPVLMCDPEGEQFWPGQSRRLHDALAGPKRLVR